METEEEWACARCTLQNEAGASTCAACGVARGAADSESDVSVGDSDGSEGDDYDMACGLDGPDEAAHAVAIHVAKRKWEETEARRTKARDEAAARDGGAAISFDEKKAAKAQIFTSQARAACALRCRACAQPCRVPCELGLCRRGTTTEARPRRRASAC